MVQTTRPTNMLKTINPKSLQKHMGTKHNFLNNIIKPRVNQQYTKNIVYQKQNIETLNNIQQSINPKS